MDRYIKGEVIKALREKKKMTQTGLAEKIGVTDKAVSKWETGRGLPAQEPDEPDEDHHIRVETTEGELYVKVDHS